MPRLRTMVAFVWGLLVALFFGLVPPEVISWLSEWSGRPGPDGNRPASSGKRRRRKRCR
jgi:hypothetical protein